MRSGIDDGYRVRVTDSRIRRSANLQATVEYSERVAAVFELKR